MLKLCRKSVATTALGVLLAVPGIAFAHSSDGPEGAQPEPGSTRRMGGGMMGGGMMGGGMMGGGMMRNRETPNVGPGEKAAPREREQKSRREQVPGRQAHPPGSDSHGEGSGSDR